MLRCIRKIPSLSFWRQARTLESMFYPVFVLPKHVCTAKLATLPVNSKRFFTCSMSNMIINFSQVESQNTIFALFKHAMMVTFVKQMICKLPNVDQTITFLAKNKKLALVYHVLTLILVKSPTIQALSLLLTVVLLRSFRLTSRLQRVTNHRLFTVL